MKSWINLVVFYTLTAVQFTVVADSIEIIKKQEGNDGNILSLECKIQDAYKQGKRKFVLPPGVYKISCAENKESHLRFCDMKDFEIDATGVSLIFENTSKTGISFENCKNVAFKGATLRRNSLSFSQGSIIKIAPDRTYIDIRIHDGYPLVTDISTFSKDPILTIFEQKNSKLKKNILDQSLTTKKMEKLADRVIRFHLRNPFDPRMPLATGDMAAWWIGRLVGSIAVRNCAEMSIIGITIKGGGMGIHEGRGEGGNYYSYTVTYPDKPTGASINPLISGAADGFHSTDVRKGPILENCLWEGINDDAVNIHGDYSLVLEANGDSVIISSGMNNLKPGDVIQFLDTNRIPQMKAKVLSFSILAEYTPPDKKLSTETPAHLTNSKTANKNTSKSKAKYLQIRFDKITPAQIGWVLVDLSACGSGYAIKNCITREHRARGFLLYAPNGIVENCLIERCSYGGIVLASSARSCGEGPYPQNTIIRNNIIREVGFATEFWNNGLSIVAWENGAFVPLPGGHNNVIVEGNRFENNDGPNIMISSAVGIKIKGNIFVNPMNEPYHGLISKIYTEALISLTECRDISFEDNKIINPGSYMKKIINLTPTAFASGVETGFVIDPSKSSR